ncbi:uncharacterized protein LOC110434460 [Sorghum bicolor]|uniref:uncharacterized protein LOC110434460 n=1 Tax=Sorghum bicolor TaxID=4558 RepID=UPI0007F1E4A3|nr:uncharacterized protein LOC110434460 [Sorghum bicolor]|eukprot:XP_021314216.1 uncharacterized protein LOC110434460 [Sorghum bicolor]
MQFRAPSLHLCLPTSLLLKNLAAAIQLEDSGDLMVSCPTGMTNHGGDKVQIWRHQQSRCQRVVAGPSRSDPELHPGIVMANILMVATLERSFLYITKSFQYPLPIHRSSPSFWSTAPPPVKLHSRRLRVRSLCHSRMLGARVPLHRRRFGVGRTEADRRNSPTSHCPLHYLYIRSSLRPRRPSPWSSRMSSSTTTTLARHCI